MRIDDARGSRVLHLPGWARDHEVPILGVRPDDDVRIEVTAVGERDAVTADPVRYRNGRLPRRFPKIDLLALDPDRVEPGLTVLPVELVSDDESLPYLVALDEAMEVVWVWAAPREHGALVVHRSGALYALGDDAAWELSPAGEILHQWGADRAAGVPPRRFTRLDLGRLHHELVPQPRANRFLALSRRRVDVDDYPCAYAAPRASCGPARIEDTRVVQFTRDGEVVRDLSMAERLDTFRIGWDALDTLAGGARDWSHGNAVIPRPDGGWLVSLRHQDALVAVDRDGEVAWILSDPAGWGPPWSDLLLEPVGDLTWPNHQHGPSYADDGTLWVFDNGNWDGTPYDGAGPREQSRVVGFAVDAEARAVRQVAAFTDTATGPMYSRALGNAAWLPVTGNVLGVYGMPTAENGVEHEDLGFGSRAVRLVQWAPDGAVVADVRLRSDVDDERKGWRSYRAVHAPSLYAEGVERWP